MSNGRDSSFTIAGPAASRFKIARRVGSVSALSHRPEARPITSRARFVEQGSGRIDGTGLRAGCAESKRR
jgi:hypothetical protein